MDPKPYLDYIDKEMTIMGILSAFSVAAPAGILVTVMGKDSLVAANLWNSEQFFVIAGSVLCVLAGFLFYKQRSILAWFYGQICLVQARDDNEEKLDAQLGEWLKDADAWSTWWPYCCGFTCLSAGFVEYLFALIFFTAPMHWNWLSIHMHSMKLLTFSICPFIAFIICVLQYYVRTRYKYDDNAWLEFARTLVRRK